MNDADPSPQTVPTDDPVARMRAMTDELAAQDAQPPQNVVQENPTVPPGVRPEDSPAADAPKAKKAKKSAAAPVAAPQTVRFVSKDPGLIVLLGGEGRDVRFEKGVAEVTPEIAALLEANHLYLYDHISRADEVVKVNGKLVSFKGDPGFREQLAEAARDGLTIFFLDAPRGTRVPLGGGLVVTFSNGRAAVDAKTAERLRRHRFYVEGRLTEITN